MCESYPTLPQVHETWKQFIQCLHTIFAHSHGFPPHSPRSSSHLEPKTFSLVTWNEPFARVLPINSNSSPTVLMFDDNLRLWELRFGALAPMFKFKITFPHIRVWLFLQKHLRTSFYERSFATLGTIIHLQYSNSSKAFCSINNTLFG